ncbi:MAG: hypothetical protein IM638_09775 [Bacteroidetes bacterium]|nr:hypothetical protein [Bacteroidota bacterium]
MRLIDLATNEFIPGEITLLSAKELKELRGNRAFEFKWREEAKYEIYKLSRTDTAEILGLMSVVNSPESFAVQIRLLETGKPNVGAEKKIDGIAGCLIAWACRLSIKRGFDGWVKLVAKTRLIRHYVTKYRMIQIGKSQVCAIEQDEAISLIYEYLEMEDIVQGENEYFDDE